MIRKPGVPGRTSAGMVGLFVGVVGPLLAGCDPAPGSGPARSSRAAPSPTASADPSVAAASQDVLSLYRAYRAAYTAAATTADYRSEELLRYLEPPLKQNVVGFLMQTSQHGAAYRGEARSDPRVVAVHLDTSPQTAVIDDCFDATNWHLVYLGNNSPVPEGSGPRRYVMTTTATFFTDGRGWRLTASDGHPERTC